MGRGFKAMSEEAFNLLLSNLKTLELGIRAATRVADMEVRPELGVTPESKVLCVSEVLRVSAARADGDYSQSLSPEAMTVMKVAAADVEVRILWSRLGLRRSA